MKRLEPREVELAYARLFATGDGVRVLSHLTSTTLMRSGGPEADDHALRFHDGQRALVVQMLRMVERGRD